MDDVIVNEMGLLSREINCTCTKMDNIKVDEMG